VRKADNKQSLGELYNTPRHMSVGVCNKEEQQATGVCCQLPKASLVSKYPRSIREFYINIQVTHSQSRSVIIFAENSTAIHGTSVETASTVIQANDDD
jgi:hypothetical protein